MWGPCRHAPTYTHTQIRVVNQKDLQPREYDGAIPFFMDKKPPSSSLSMAPFDLIRVSIMPKNDENAKKAKKSCFTLKSVGPTALSLSSLLPHLRSTMKATKEESEAESLSIIRSDDPLPYAHQLECLPPKDDRENYSMAEVSMCSFLEQNLGAETTFT